MQRFTENYDIHISMLDSSYTAIALLLVCSHHYLIGIRFLTQCPFLTESAKGVTDGECVDPWGLMCADHVVELKYIAFVNDGGVSFGEDALTGAHCLASKTVHGHQQDDR